MKALREKLTQRRLEKSAVRNKFSSKNQDYNLTSPSSKRSSDNESRKSNKTSSKRSYSESIEDDDIISSSRSISSTFSRYSKIVMSSSQNDKTTFTPQMRSLYEKIQRKPSTSVVDKIAKGDLKDKQELNITKQILPKTENQEKNISNKRSDWNKYDIKQKQSIQTNKNLAQERMQKLRKSLAHEMQKREDGCSIITEMPPERLNKTLPSSFCKYTILYSL